MVVPVKICVKFSRDWTSPRFKKSKFSIPKHIPTCRKTHQPHPLFFVSYTIPKKYIVVNSISGKWHWPTLNKSKSITCTLQHKYTFILEIHHIYSWNSYPNFKHTKLKNTHTHTHTCRLFYLYIDGYI